MPVTGVDETMTTPQITALPPAPTPQDSPEAFNDKAFRVLAAQEAFVEEANELAEFVNQKTSDAAAASVSAGQAAQSAEGARDDAIAAKNVVVGVASQFGDVGSAIAFAEDAAQRSFTQAQVAANASQVAELARDAATVAKNAAVAAEQSIDSRAEQITTDATLAAVGAVTTQVESARDVAVAAKDGAELARDAAIAAAGPLYATEAEGRAAVADGETFKVVGTGGAAAAIYRRVSATASTLLLEMPSVDGVKNMSMPQRGIISSGALNAYTEQGVYLVSPPTAITDMPYGHDSTASHNLENIKVSTGDRFVLQRLSHFTRPAMAWVRRIDKNNLAANAPWLPVSEQTITLSGVVDLNSTDIEFSGRNWVLTDTILNGPAGFSGAAALKVTRFGSFQLQELRSLSALDELTSYARWVRPGNGVFQPWRKRTVSDQDAYGIVDASTDLNTLLDYRAQPAGWVVTAKPINAPDDWVSGGVLRLSQTGDWLTQELSALHSPSTTWRRRVRLNVDPVVFHPWERIGPSFGVGSSTRRKWVFFGDSITEFGNYPELVGWALNLDVVKAGFGGCRMAVHNLADYDPMSMYRIAQCVASGNFAPLVTGAQTLYDNRADDNRAQAAAVANANWPSVDGVTIFFGTNDFGGNVPIGTNADQTGETFKGALNITIDSLLGAYPGLDIMFVTPIYRSRGPAGNDKDSDDYPNTLGVYLRDYSAAIKEIASKHHIPVFDLGATSGIGKLTAATLIPDGIHPAAGHGYARIANRIGAAMRQTFFA